MDRENLETSGRKGKLAHRVMMFFVVTFAVAVLGGVIGLALGQMWGGALFGAVIGFWGCLRSGYVMDEPNVVKPPF